MKKLKLGVKLLRLKAYSKEIENMSQRTNSTSSTGSMKSRFVPLAETDFDWNSIVVDNPKKSGRYNCAFSRVFVKDGNEEKSLSFELEKQDIWGLSWSYKDMNKKDSANINGTQLKYPLTSFETRTAPTLLEQETQNRINKIVGIVGSNLQRFYKHKDTRKELPDIGDAKKIMLKTAPSDLVKIPYSFPKNKETKELDTTRPLEMYLNFKTSGVGIDKIRCHTVFKGRKRNETFRNYLYDPENSTRACSHIALRWESVYYGAHGTNDAIASAKLVVQHIKLSKPMVEFEPVADEEAVLGDSEYEEDSDEESDQDEYVLEHN